MPYKERIDKNKAVARRAEVVKEFIRSFKENPCMDCGIKYPHYIMDFDHFGESKLFNISSMTTYSFEKIKQEIAKCDLVCSNCHRERTWQRKEYSKNRGRVTQSG